MDKIPKILLVDDRIENIIALEKLFSGLDIDFIRANSGNEALQKTLEHDFALALIDVQMPDMDGYETVELMRQNKKTENLPVIFISAIYSEDFYQVKGIEAGAVDFITKPVNPKILIGKILVHLELYRHKVSLQEAHDNLEILVRERTNELVSINDQLIKESTERNKLEEERQKSHKLESIGILAGGIAHDFNNILAAIMNSVYLVKMTLDHENINYQNIESIEKAINRATNLTQQLLTFSRGGTPVKKTASVFDLIEESAEFALKGSNVKCEFIVSDDLWTVEVDEGQINQVIHNLILNADQAMPEGGTIRIKEENYELGSDTGLPLEQGRYLKIVIQDQGIGIEKEHLLKIFDPYFTTKEMGRGLGLSIIYSIIKNHEGLITVESEKGTGTTFTIYLPVSEKQMEEKETALDIPLIGEGKILLMDDEDIIRDSVSRILNIKGYEVEYAKDGSEAIAIYEKAMKTSKPFAAVVLDLTVRGGMGGKEAVKRLREIDPDVKAIVSSGYSNDLVMANFHEYGFCDVFCKAFNGPEDLCKILNKTIKG